jgi:uncharacterized protein with GYD domain
MLNRAIGGLQPEGLTDTVLHPQCGAMPLVYFDHWPPPFCIDDMTVPMVPPHRGPASKEEGMQTFMCSFSWTDSGILDLSQTPHRRAAAKKHATWLGISIKDIYLTTGEADLLYILEAPDAESVTKFALLASSSGNVRTKISRAFTAAEFDKMLDDLAHRPTD